MPASASDVYRIDTVWRRVEHSPDFRGCPFLGAATELKDRDHPALRVAGEQKVGLTAYFAEAVHDGGGSDPDMLALQMVLIFDGASAYSTVRGGSTPATRQAVETLLSAHGM